MKILGWIMIILLFLPPIYSWSRDIIREEGIRHYLIVISIHVVGFLWVALAVHLILKGSFGIL